MCREVESLELRVERLLPALNSKLSTLNPKKETSSTMAFKTEFEFTLPKGYVDDKGNLHRKGTMRLATAKDEIIPLQDFRVKNNRAFLVILLLPRVISKLGELKEGEVNPGIVESLFSADLSYLQEFYRQINESGTANVGAKCPSCGQEFQVDIGTGATALGES